MLNSMRRRWLPIAVLLAALPPLWLSPAQAAERVVNVYNWSDYVDPAVLERFTAETGIRVVYDVYDTNEVLETKLLAGRSGYDLVVPSGPFLQRLIRAGVFGKLDKTKLPGLKNVWPEIARRLETYDPGNLYAVNYMWGTTGLGLNLKAVRSRLGPDQPLDTLDLLLRPDLAAKLKDCGIEVLDAPEDVLPTVLNALRFPPDSHSPDDLNAATDALMRVRPNIRRFHSSAYLNDLASGETCLALGYSGDVLQAKRRAEEARNGIEIGYVIPKEGALMWFDSLAIPADAPHPAEAYVLLDYLLRPDVAAANTNFIRYANGNAAARPLVKPEIAGDPTIYPDETTFARLFTNTAYDDRTQKLVTRLWNRVRSGP